MIQRLGFAVFVLCFAASAWGHAENRSVDNLRILRAYAKDKVERTKIVNLGIPIDGLLSDGVTIVGTEEDARKIEALGIRVDVEPLPFMDDFPTADKEFHNYQEMTDALNDLVKAKPNLVSKISIGKSLEGREMVGVRISSTPTWDSKPTAIFMGCHHAREHLSVEVPLMLAQHLIANYERDSRIKALVDQVEIYIVPMINPDGAEFDIATGSYKYWRKNRRKNADGTFGVDLNRNYGGGEGFWGGPGSSGTPSSDTYRGTAEFSEPETQAVRDFVRARTKTTVLLTFHTFSELVLWPYGHTNDNIKNATDLKVFETMGKKMATWNKYTPQKSSDLYLAAGDTTDWAYEEKKIFAFTFELSPSSIFGGGFYPGAEAIEPTFKANLEPSLYLIEKAVNPYSVLRETIDPLNIL